MYQVISLHNSLSWYTLHKQLGFATLFITLFNSAQHREITTGIPLSFVTLHYLPGLYRKIGLNKINTLNFELSLLFSEVFQLELSRIIKI